MTFRFMTTLLAAALGAGCTYDWAVTHDGGITGDASADAATEAGPTADGATSFSCDGAFLCDDFDGPPLGQTWQDIFLAAGGSVRIEAFASAASAPSVLFASRPAQTVAPATAYVSSKQFTQNITRGTLLFSVWPEQLDAQSATCIAGIIFTDGVGNEHLVRLLVSDGKASVQEKTPTLTSYPLSSGIPLHAWSRVSLAIQAGGNIVVRVNEVTTLDVLADPSWAASSSTRVFVGINFEDTPIGATAVRFDNVRYDGS
ncbi:MAG: hypothetical protein ABIP89_18725 [Polyangiaceae bacterium]